MSDIAAVAALPAAPQARSASGAPASGGTGFTEAYADLEAARTNALQAAELQPAIKELLDEVHVVLEGDAHAGMTTLEIFRQEIEDARNPFAAIQRELDKLHSLLQRTESALDKALSNPSLQDEASDLTEASAALRKEIAALEAAFQELKTKMERAFAGRPPLSGPATA